MKNDEIIEKVAREIYGDTIINEIINRGDQIELHSAMGWASRGYFIKKGEKGIETKLWRKRKSKVEGINDQFYLCKAFLFTKDQVICKGQAD